jgi:pimeloyl-ACP methyl ester carboxylesterase
MNVFFFGGGERRLFGVYEAARRIDSTRAAVLCPAWGTEYIHAHRAMRRLAKMLTAENVHTLRFDYFGVGDSAGETEAGGLRGWETDIRTAVEELKDSTGARQVSLVGLRLGATLAANVAVEEAANVGSLVLWDPVVYGTEHLAELYRTAGTGRLWKRRPGAGSKNVCGVHNIMGFPMTAALAAEIRQIDLAALAPRLPARTLTLASQAVPSHVRLQQALDQRKAALAVEHIDSPPVCVEWPLGHPLAGTVPVQVLQRIVEWLA